MPTKTKTYIAVSKDSDPLASYQNSEYYTEDSLEGLKEFLKGEAPYLQDNGDPSHIIWEITCTPKLRAEVVPSQMLFEKVS